MATSTQHEHLAYADLKQLERLRSGIAMLVVACICCVACVMLTGISELSLFASGAWDSVRHWVTGLCWCAFGIVWLMSLRRIAWGGLYANRNILTSNMQSLTGLAGLIIIVFMFLFVLELIMGFFDGDGGFVEDDASLALDFDMLSFAPFLLMMYCVNVLIVIGQRAGLRIQELSLAAAMMGVVAGMGVSWLSPKFFSAESAVGALMLGGGVALGYAACLMEQFRQRLEAMIEMLREGDGSHAERDAIVVRFSVVVPKHVRKLKWGAR